ncbi:MAG: hypothetical protein LH631_10435 [Alkalinema sp. CAN_BIN05]|nr:hypothetical protein [Alkalinema sp. CAN_BIN05]
MIRVKGLSGWTSVISVAAVSLIIGWRSQTMAQSVGSSSGPLTPPVIQSGPNAGTTPDLRLPDRPGVGTCRTNCPLGRIQFKPGSPIQIQIFNRTDRPISVEKVADSTPIMLQGKQKIVFSQGGEKSDNPSIVFWERNNTPIRVKLSQPKANTLFIDLSFAAQKPGDQSVYMRNDGRVDVF